MLRGGRRIRLPPDRHGGIDGRVQRLHAPGFHLPPQRHQRQELVCDELLEVRDQADALTLGVITLGYFKRIAKFIATEFNCSEKLVERSFISPYQ
jgi:hypothetical protein